MAYKGKNKHQFDNTNRGVAFKNEDMRPDKKDANYRGSINVEGVEYWLNVWINDHDEKGKYLSFGVTKKEPKPQQAFEPKAAPAAKPVKAKAADPDDELPF